MPNAGQAERIAPHLKIFCGLVLLDVVSLVYVPYVKLDTPPPDRGEKICKLPEEAVVDT